MITLAAVGTIAAIVVGAVLVWAGFTKLLAGAMWIRQAANMGVGHRLAALVPWVEVVVGASLAAGVFSPWPAVAAGLLLLAFTVLIALRLVDGSRPPCACFGLRSNRPLGPLHLARNAVLLGLVALTLLSA